MELERAQGGSSAHEPAETSVHEQCPRPRNQSSQVPRGFRTRQVKD